MKKRFLKILAVAVTLLFVFAVIGGGGVAYFAYRENLAGTFSVSAPEIREDVTDAARGVPVGEPFEIHIATDSALTFATPFQVECLLPDGLESRENITQDFDFAWTHRRGEIRLSLVAFTAGEFKDAKMTISASADGLRKQELVELPPIFAVLPETAPGETLQLAGTLSENASTEKQNWLWLAAVVLPILALTALVFLRKKKAAPEPEIPAWIAAQNELEALRDEISAGRTSAIAAVTRLSDIVRRYLSRRFGLSADAMTSQEFFATMERDESPLAAKHRQFLREFLSAADLIKFAGVVASSDQAHTALDRATALVSETVPAPQPSAETR